MESIYAALLLHKAQKSITATSLKKVLDAAGASVDDDQVKKVVAALKQTNIDDLIKNASAAPVAVAAVAPAAQEEKSEYTVTLEDGGSEKIKVMKALRKVTTLALTDAKKAVEGAPTVIAESVSKEDAGKMKAELEAAGAKVKLS